MIKVGLTGGIGSGKTTVAKIFEVLGIPVYYSDIQAKKILFKPETIEKIRHTFGEKVFEKGKLSKKLLAKIVFNDKEKLQKLNSIIHPAVKTDFKNWLEKQNAPYVVKEAAILFESGAYKDMDFIITVFAPVEERIKRVMKRDNISREEVIRRIENQWTDEKKIKLSDFVIKNYNSFLVIPQVLEIHNKLRSAFDKNSKVRK